jgi:hypothetical protein
MKTDVAITGSARMANPLDAKLGLFRAMLNADDLSGLGYTEQVAQPRPVFGYVDRIR